mgnify:CR=1 FL=1
MNGELKALLSALYWARRGSDWSQEQAADWRTFPGEVNMHLAEQRYQRALAALAIWLVHSPDSPCIGEDEPVDVDALNRDLNYTFGGDQ